MKAVASAHKVKQMKKASISKSAGSRDTTKSWVMKKGMEKTNKDMTEKEQIGSTKLGKREVISIINKYICEKGDWQDRIGLKKRI